LYEDFGIRGGGRGVARGGHWGPGPPVRKSKTFKVL